MHDDSDAAPMLRELERAQTVAGLLRVLAVGLVELLHADACLVSRAIGDMLVDLVEHSPRGAIPGGHGYLISDFPATQRVLEDGEAETVFAGDDAADAHEVELLRQLGFESLLMLPISFGQETWGLVEVYRSTRFSGDDVTRSLPLVTRAAELIPRLLA